MNYLNSFDYFIIALYFAFMLGLGICLKQKASESLEDYLVGGRRLPWWMLGVSGMASFLDVSGTMIIVSFLYMLGPRGIFIEFRGGAVLALPILLLWTGKWHRRSGCLTGAEWNIFRFGDGLGGRFAQVVTVFAQIIGTVGALAYLVKGVGLFLSTFFPFSPPACAFALIAVATVYTVMSGFYGVVITDFFQSMIILIAVMVISFIAISKVTDSETLSALATQVTGNKHWIVSAPQWKTAMPAGYEIYQDLGMFMMFYLFRNLFGGMGGGDDPKYFAAKSDRECGKLTFLWTVLMTIRWPMMMGFAVLGLFLVHDLFPDQTVLSQAALAIKEYYPNVSETRWTEVISEIVNYPEMVPAGLVAKMQSILGKDEWAQKLQLLSFAGTVNPERILPSVLLFSIPMGLRGLLLVALIAAAMSTFDSRVNTTAGYITRDLYQKYFRPNANTKELIYVCWCATVAVVFIGFLFAYSVKSINDIWGWIIMGLGGGLLVPSILRFYWWRFNGSGLAIGTLLGMTCALLQRGFIPDLDERLQFLIIGFIGTVGSVAGSFLAPPTDRTVLENFYRTTRPFGFWKPLKKILSEEEREAMRQEHRNDILAVPFVVLWQVTMFMLPMQLVIQAYSEFWVTLGLFFTGFIGMYFFWYRTYPIRRAPSLRVKALLLR